MKNKPTKSELEILSVLWDLREATVREVFAAIGAYKHTSYTTVLKLMQIMLEKGLVHRNEETRAHTYRAAVKRNETGQHMIGELLDRVFEGSAASLVQQILEAETTTPEELREIKDLIKRSETEAGK